MKNKNSQTKKEITVRVVNPPTKEESKEKIKKITQTINMLYRVERDKLWKRKEELNGKILVC